MSYSAEVFGYDLAFSKKAKFELSEFMSQGGFEETAADQNNVEQDTVFEYWLNDGAIVIQPNSSFKIVTISLPFVSSQCVKSPELKWAQESDSDGNGIVSFSQYRQNGGPVTPYEGFTITPDQFWLCVENPEISSINLTGKNVAGDRQVIEIRGKHFAPNQQPGKVLFTNVDDQLYPFLPGLEAEYIQLWSDSLIKVEIPSLVEDGFLPSSNKKRGGAGTGPIKVRTSLGAGTEVTSSEPIAIDYSFLNSRNSGTTGKGYLSQINCINGFVFTLDRSIGSHPDSAEMIAAIEEVLAEWAGITGITLELERIINDQGEAVLHFADGTDGERNIISRQNAALEDQGKVMAATRGVIADRLSLEHYAKNVGITIFDKPGRFYHYSSQGDLPAYSTDFQSAFAHELGHVLGLGHNLLFEAGAFYGSLMNAAQPPNSTNILASERRLLSNLSTSEYAVTGAMDMVQQSKSQSWVDDRVETLSSTNATILPTPRITPLPPLPPPLFPGQEDNLIYICPSDVVKLQSSYTQRNYWTPTENTTQIVDIMYADAGEHQVSVNDYPNCTEASLLSEAVAVLKGFRCEVPGEPNFPDVPLDSFAVIINHFIAYPNPADAFVTIEYDLTAPNGLSLFLSLYRLSTGAVETELSLGSHQGTVTIPVQSLPTDNYLLLLKSNYAAYEALYLSIMH